VVERHGEHCGEVLQFEKGENCLLAVCYTCDFCHTLGESDFIDVLSVLYYEYPQ
jgi:hypothetical protein